MGSAAQYPIAEGESVGAHAAGEDGGHRVGPPGSVTSASEVAEGSESWATLVQPTLPGVEVKGLHGEREVRSEAVKKLHCVPMAMAKVKVGAAFAHAIGEQTRKAYGHEGLVSGLCSGEKVPDYMATLYLDAGARRRFALALLAGDPKVKRRVTVEIEDDEGGH